MFSATEDLVQEAVSAKKQGDYVQSARWYQKALEGAPDNTELMMALASVLSFSLRTGDALDLYEDVLQKNPEHIGALAGRARMLWWRNQPYRALKEYRNVLKKEPGNTEAKSTIFKIERTLGMHATAVAKSIKEWENETSYTGTVLPFQEYQLEKRLSDFVHVQGGVYIDVSEKRYIHMGENIDLPLDSISFHQAYVRATWLFPYLNKVRTYGSYTLPSQDWSSYGVVWQGEFKRSSLHLEWALGGGYETFYYWSNASRDFVEALLEYTQGDWKFNTTVKRGRVRTNEIVRSGNSGDTLRFQAENDCSITRAQITYAGIPLSGLHASLFHEYYDYAEHTFSYYAPRHRQVVGVGLLYGIKRGDFMVSGDGGVGYDNGGIDMHGEDISGGMYMRGKIIAEYALGSMVGGAGIEFFNNPHYRAQIVHLYIKR